MADHPAGYRQTISRRLLLLLTVYRRGVDILTKAVYALSVMCTVYSNLQPPTNLQGGPDSEKVNCNVS